jgi:hypothetical protein
MGERWSMALMAVLAACEPFSSSNAAGSPLSGDGGVDPFADLPDPCTSGTGICEKFGDPSLPGWQGGTQAGVGVSPDAPSPPYSLSVQGSATLFISRPIHAGSVVSCELDAKVDSWDGRASFFVIKAPSSAASDHWDVGWAKKDGQLMLTQYAFVAATQAETATYPVEAPPPANTWFHVQLRAAFGGKASLVVTGVPTLETFVPAPSTADFDVNVGMSEDIAGTAQILFDNIVCAVR